MSKIGSLIEVENEGEIEFDGQIRTLAHDFDFRMIGNPDQNGMGSPDYLILTKVSSGHEVPIGAAWRRKPKRYGENDFLSITFDDPSFEKPLNVAAFVQPDGRNWVITWRRRMERNSQSEAA